MKDFYRYDVGNTNKTSNTAVNFSIAQWKAGLITDSELTESLDMHNVHGGIDQGHYAGYDYSLQAYVDTIH